MQTITTIGLDIASQSFRFMASMQMAMWLFAGALTGERWPACTRRGGGRRGRRCRVGPGNFTPSLSQIPDVILSHHPARAIARRLPPSVEISGSSRYDPVDPSSTAMTHPLCSTGITPLRHYYGAVRPSPAHRYFQPRGWSRLCFFPWHRRPGSHVPYKSLIELRAAYMPDAAWAVSVHPPSLSREKGQPPVLTSPNPLSTLLQRFACARLSQSYLPESGSDFSATFTTMALTTAACGGLRSTPDCRPRRALLHLSYSYASPCGPALLVTQDPSRT